MEGCGILGTVRNAFSASYCRILIYFQGGGGSPYPAYLICRQILRDGGTISIVDHSSLNDDDVVARGGAYSNISYIENRNELIGICGVYHRVHGLTICRIGAHSERCPSSNGCLRAGEILWSHTFCRYSLVRGLNSNGVQVAEIPILATRLAAAMACNLYR